MIPGPDSLGTWFYGATHKYENLPDGYSVPATYANGGGHGTAGGGAIADLPGWASGGAPAVVSKPSTSGYDYGTAGLGGIPWSSQAKPLPDPFNFSLDYIK